MFNREKKQLNHIQRSVMGTIDLLRGGKVQAATGKGIDEIDLPFLTQLNRIESTLAQVLEKLIYPIYATIEDGKFIFGNSDGLHQYDPKNEKWIDLSEILRNANKEVIGFKVGDTVSGGPFGSGTKITKVATAKPQPTKRKPKKQTK